MRELRQKYLNACLGGDIETVAYMVKNEDLNFRNSKFLVECLKNACKGNHLDVSKIILCDRGMFNKMDYVYRLDIVCYVFRTGNLHICKFYQNITDSYKFIPGPYFRAACVSGNVALIKDILHYCMSSLRDLYYVCRSGCIEIVNLFISRGSKEWSNGLYGVCYGRGDHVEIAEIMIANGAIISDTFLYAACSVRNIKIINLLVHGGVKNWNKGMCGACRGGYMDIVVTMIEKGATDWDSGMDNACKGGHLDIVKFMVSKGANDWERCFIDEFFEYKRFDMDVEIVKFLFLQGADLNYCLECACFHGDIDFVEALIKNGATNWNKGLIGACRGGYLSLVKLMLDHGATDIFRGLSTNATNTHNTNISTLLISKGADNFINFGNTRNFRLLYLYNKYVKNEFNNYVSLLPDYPPCVLFVGSRLSKNNCCHVKRFPLELFKVLCQYC